MFQELVKNWMTRTPVTIASTVHINEAHKVMNEKRVRRLMVIDDGRLVGIVTLNDLLKAEPSTEPHMAAYELGYLIDNLTVKHVMHSPVLTIRPETTVAEAATLMRRHKVGGLPVVSDNKIIGIITESDLFRGLVRGGKFLPLVQSVGEWMSRRPIIASPSDSLATLHEMMKSNRVRRLPVTVDGKLVGIVTLKDVQRALPSEATTLSIEEINTLIEQVKAENIMARDVLTVTPHTTVGEAAQLMLSNKIGGLPVVDNEQLVGMITESDIFRLIAQNM